MTLLETPIAIATLATLVGTLALNAYVLWRMVLAQAESRQARTEQQAATRRAEASATAAAVHAETAVAAITEVASNVLKIEVATNSMKDALIVSTAKASEFEGAERGRTEEVARRDAATVATIVRPDADGAL